MPSPLKTACALVLFSCALPAIGQLAPPVQVPNRRPPIQVRRPPVKTARQEPCWQEAGISKGALEQRRSIQQSARAEIQSVCANSSLTPQQRREQIRAIHERTRQQIDALISPQQREAVKACQEARAGGHRGGGGFHGGAGRGEGPCGELNEPREAPTERQP